MKEKKIPQLNRFAVFIFCWGRPYFDNTYQALRKHGYTGRIVLICDDLDETRYEYIEKYGAENVYIFNKRWASKHSDPMNNFGKYESTLYVENSMFEIASDLNLESFCAMCDDYNSFCHKQAESEIQTKSLDEVFSYFLEYLMNSPIKCLAFSQGGDHIGGYDPYRRTSKRKVMNSFICLTERPFSFYGSMNDDTNMYVRNGVKGDIFLTVYCMMLHQPETQNTKGGLTDLYTSFGTFVKSFYTVILCPSAVKIALMGHSAPRLHHKINYKKAFPCIIRESYKK